jgi:hypothetical protein
MDPPACAAARVHDRYHAGCWKPGSGPLLRELQKTYAMAEEHAVHSGSSRGTPAAAAADEITFSEGRSKTMAKTIMVVDDSHRCGRW